MTTVQETLKELEKTLACTASKIEKLKALHELFPDLNVYKGRWQTVEVAASANSKGTDYEFRYSCGCCRDAAIQLWMYVVTPHGKVYSDPPYATVGEQGYSDDIPCSDWREVLQKIGVTNQAIYEAVERRFAGATSTRAEEDE